MQQDDPIDATNIPYKTYKWCAVCQRDATRCKCANDSPIAALVVIAATIVLGIMIGFTFAAWFLAP